MDPETTAKFKREIAKRCPDGAQAERRSKGTKLPFCIRLAVNSNPHHDRYQFIGMARKAVANSKIATI